MHKNRLMWASRRGMLELDLILQPFVEDHYDRLSEEDKLRFHALLELEDQQLFNWFLKKEKPLQGDMQRIVTIIYDSRTHSI
jgi:antitoxin CptB